MKRVIVLFALLFAAVVAYVLLPDEPSSAPARVDLSTAVKLSDDAFVDPRARGTLLVAVTWADGTPAPGVAVTVRERFTVSTDASGRCHFTDLAPGYALVTTDRDGRSFAMVPEGGITDLSIAVATDLTVTGLVVDTRRWPVAGATIYHDGLGEGAPTPVATTDASGGFEVRGLPLPARLRAWHADYQESFNVHATSDFVEFVLHDEGRGFVGTVRDRAGVPISEARATFALFDDDGSKISSRESETNADGHFTLAGLLAREGVFTVQHEQFVTHEEVVDLTDTLLTTRDAVLDPGWIVRGVVTNDVGERLSGASVSLAGHSGVFDDTWTDGRFEIANLPTGWHTSGHQLEATHASHRSVVFPDTRDVGPMFEWNPRLSPGGTLVITSAWECGDPVVGATVWLEKAGGGRRERHSDERGRVSFGGLEDVAYSVIVLIDRVEVARADGVYLGDDVAFAVPALGSLVGRFVDAEGDRVYVTAASITHTNANGELIRRRLSVGLDGRYDAKLARGHYELHVDDKSLEPINALPFEVVSALTTDLGDTWLTRRPNSKLTVAVQCVDGVRHGDVRLTLHDVSGERLDRSFVRITDGRYRLTWVAPGTYEVRLRGVGVAAKNARVEAVLHKHGELKMTAQRGTRLTLRVEWQNKRAATFDVVISQDGETFLERKVVGAKNPHYVSAWLMPDLYDVEVFEPGAARAWEEVDVRAYGGVQHTFEIP